jgi:hypothetical protein
MRLRRGSFALLGALAALAAPSSALAASASVSGGVLTYQAGAGESNQVTLGYSGGSTTVSDPGAIIEAGPGCSLSSAGHKAACDGAFSVVATLSDRNDSAVSVMLFTPVTVDGGEGDDSLTGSSTADTFLGGSGADTISGGWGSDTLTGGDGIDSVDGSYGNDKLFLRDGAVDTAECGSGTDSGERDADEAVSPDCEAIVPPGVEIPVEDPGGVPDDGGTDDPATDVLDPVEEVMPVVLAQKPRANAQGAIPIRVRCPAAATAGCVGTISVALADDSAGAARRRSAPKPGRKRFKLAPGQTKAVPVRLARRAARRLKARGAVKLKATIEVEVDGGQTLASVHEITVRERRTANRRAVRKSRGRKK